MLTQDIFAQGTPHFYFFIGEFIGGILVIIQMIAAIKAISRDSSNALTEVIRLTVIFFFFRIFLWII
jgi:hypothetical protein